MPANHRSVLLEQFCHLCLRQPDSILVHFYLQIGRTICGLIDDYLVVYVIHIINNAIYAILLHKHLL